MKHFIILLFLSLSFTTFSQKVIKNGKVYKVKKDKIFLDGNNVTGILKVEEREAIYKEQALILQKLKLEEEAEKKADELKKAEKAKKKKEKAIKKKEKLKKSLKKEEDNLKKAKEKHEKLKKKGDLSPNDEQDWVEKFEKLNKKIAKVKKKL